MKNVIIFTIAFISLMNISATNYASFSTSASFSSFGDVGSGLVTSYSGTYSNIGCVGQTATGNSSSLNYKNYAGVVPAFITIVDVIISFMDAYPSSSEVQDSTIMVSKITVESTGGNTIAVVKYMISNSGSADSSFMSAQADVSTNTYYSGSKIRFQVLMPNTAGQVFSQSDNNYIKWWVKTSGGVERWSDKYQIKVHTNDSPLVTITQPDEKGGLASSLPLIQAVINDQYGGVDETSIQIRLDKESGENLLSLNSALRPDIFTVAKNLVSYKYDQSALSAESSYRLTISVNDNSGAPGSSSILFKVKGGAIADLVPYPSPFDPAGKTQPLTLRYILNKNSEVSVSIYDMSGRLVKTVVNNQSRDAGISEEQWFGDNFAGNSLANGIYVCEVVAKDEDGEHRRYSSLAIFGK